VPNSPDVRASAPAHTAAEVEAALNAIFPSSPQLLKLQQYAGYRVAAIGRAAEGRTEEDLVNEAVTLTLEGQRNWSSAVDIVGHLIGVMKSVSSHWAEQVNRRDAVTLVESDVSNTTQDGRVVSAGTRVTQHPCNSPSVERTLVARSQVEQIRQAFVDDPLVTKILDLMAAEVTDGPSIKASLNLSQTQYETAIKRLRRTARSQQEEG
jgi:hypothetical protein